MTSTQERIVKQIRAWVEEHDLYRNDDKYEFKRWEIKPLDGTNIIAVYSETGLKGDEDTMAAVFCRNHRHVFVGPRGKVTAYKTNRETGDTKEYNGFTNVMIHCY